MDVEQRARGLPPLPEPARICTFTSKWHTPNSIRVVGYTAEQMQEYARAALTPPEGHVVVTRNEAGQAVAVIRQDDEGRILSVIAEFEPVKGDMGNPISIPDGYVLVPVEPTPGLLMSMAIRRDHALGCPGYYDLDMFTAGGHVGHQRILEVAISEARKQHEEVVGTGFYSAEKEAGYAAMLSARPEVKND